MKKLRDCTEEEVKEYCVKKCCDGCPLNHDTCLRYFFENDKTMLSDKALDIELPIENKILDDEEKAFLTKVVMLYKEMHCEVKGIAKVHQEVYDNCYRISFNITNNVIKWAERRFLPDFANANMYKGMKVGELYTLEQLGIVIEEKHKMTIDEFFNSKDNLAIHCNTEEKANKLCEAFSGKKYRWFDGKKYNEENRYEWYGKKTCYINDNCLSAFDRVKKVGWTILEFEDIDLK